MADAAGVAGRGKDWRFSRRTAWDTRESEWARLLKVRRSAGLPVMDLTVSNPTRCGFDYDAAAVLGPLSDARGLDYEPDPRGMPAARQAVCGYYADHGAAVEPWQVLLTTSTSEAYSFIFRLLCDPGDEVLVAQPSYPLFDFLAELDDVRTVPYPLFYDYGWQIDVHALRGQITPRTRALVVVNPNNPTGHFTSAEERRQLEAVCVEHGLALIVDEVFLDYPVEAEGGTSFAGGEHPVLTFVLSGLSKIAALPQMKFSWLACFGPDAAQAGALDRLEVIADTFLSMNAPVQLAAASWFEGRRGIQAQIRRRVAANLAALDGALSPASAVTRLRVEGGWSAVLRVPALERDDQTAVELLDGYGIAVHPGSLFGFSGDGWLVLSLLTPQLVFADALATILFYFKYLGYQPLLMYRAWFRC